MEITEIIMALGMFIGGMIVGVLISIFVAYCVYCHNKGK